MSKKLGANKFDYLLISKLKHGHLKELDIINIERSALVPLSTHNICFGSENKRPKIEIRYTIFNYISTVTYFFF